MVYSNKDESQVVPVLNKVPRHNDIPCLIKHQAMKTEWGTRGIAPRIINLGTRWR